MRQEPSESLRRFWERSNKTCWLCLTEVALRAASKDHVVPKTHGGTKRDGIKLAHRRCNSLWGSDEGAAWVASSADRRNTMHNHNLQTPLELLRYLAANDAIRGINKGQRSRKPKAERLQEKADVADYQGCGYFYDAQIGKWRIEQKSSGQNRASSIDAP